MKELFIDFMVMFIIIGGVWATSSMIMTRYYISKKNKEIAEWNKNYNHIIS